MEKRVIARVANDESKNKMLADRFHIFKKKKRAKLTDGIGQREQRSKMANENGSGPDYLCRESSKR